MIESKNKTKAEMYALYHGGSKSQIHPQGGENVLTTEAAHLDNDSKEDGNRPLEIPENTNEEGSVDTKDNKKEMNIETDKN